MLEPVTVSDQDEHNALLLCMPHGRPEASLPSLTDGQREQRRAWTTMVLSAMVPWPVCFRSSRVANTVPRPVAASRPRLPCKCTGCTPDIHEPVSLHGAGGSRFCILVTQRFMQAHQLRTKCIAKGTPQQNIEQPNQRTLPVTTPGLKP